MKSDKIEEHQKYIDEFHKKYISVKDASKEYGMSPQAFYIAINQKKINAVDVFGKLWVLRKDIAKYSKYSHLHKRDEGGKTIFRNGYMSVSKLADLMECSRNKIYYSIRKNYIRAKKHGTTVMVHKNEIRKLKLIADLGKGIWYKK